MTYLQRGAPCAGGFGVCCIFRIGCGGESRENNTIFTSEIGRGEDASGVCGVRICPCSDSICQLRLDFINFNIVGPSTGAAGKIGALVNGALSAQAGGVDVTDSTRCILESFTVSNFGGNAPPVICGNNDGQHMYVDLDQDCTDLTFLLDGNPQNSNWIIRAIQYECSFENLAPFGCTQWYFGSLTGMVSTYNFAGGLHLANQRQTICVRREVNQCRLCWNAAAAIDFQLSGPGMMALTDDNLCCAYDFNNNLGFDCAVIPLASTQANSKKLNANVFCGASKGLAAIGSITGANPTIIVTNKLPNQTICTRSVPFSISFRSDNFEYLGETANNPNGFRLIYDQESCS